MRAVLVLLLLLTLPIGVAVARFQLAAADYAPITCVPDKETWEKIRTILLDSAETALKNHVVRMHEVWMKDPDTNQPARARNGTWQGIKAYIAGRNAVLRWNPPIC